MDWNDILQSSLMTLIQVLLPILLTVAIGVGFRLYKKYAAQLSVEEFAMVKMLVENLVKAAEQNGLIGAIGEKGAEKKAWVFHQLEAALKQRNIKLDLNEIDNLIEGIFHDTIKRWKDEQETVAAATEVVNEQIKVAAEVTAEITGEV